MTSENRSSELTESSFTGVSVDMLRVPTKITTGQTSVVLFQEEPVGDKVLARTDGLSET